MTTIARAHSRAGLIGNPSDGYGGRAIAISVRNFVAEATCRDSDEPTLRMVGSDARDDAGLLAASVKRFRRWCLEHGVDAERPIALEVTTTVPYKLGLAGSSAIVTAVFRVLQEHFGVAIDTPMLPSLVLGVETEEMGITAGLMDRVVQTYEGVVYMDLDRDRLARDGHGRYEPLDPASLPPLFVAWDPRLAEGSEVVHNDLAARFERGDRHVLDTIAALAALADEARELLVSGRGGELGPLIDENFRLRSTICRISDGNRRLIETARAHGASAKYAGSGGAVVGTYDGDPDRLKTLTVAYDAAGAKLIVPEIC